MISNVHLSPRTSSERATGQLDRPCLMCVGMADMVTHPTRATAATAAPEIGASTYPKERPLESASVCAATVRRRNPLLLDPRRTLHRRTAPLSR